jgi:hypothetical protein
MGAFRFRRRIKVAPGVTLNIGKRGVSTSIGPRGAKFTVGTHGRRATIGLPGTGMSYTQKIGRPSASTADALTAYGYELDRRHDEFVASVRAFEADLEAGRVPEKDAERRVAEVQEAIEEYGRRRAEDIAWMRGQYMQKAWLPGVIGSVLMVAYFTGHVPGVLFLVAAYLILRALWVVARVSLEFASLK